jgi:uncharacterized SAM-binding protein YcdF (DUF218 family)
MTDAPPGSEPYRLGKVLWDYLRVTPQLDPFPGAAQDSLILVLGSPDLTVAGHAADLFNRGVAHHLVVSGGCLAPGCGRQEADAIGELITAQGIDPGQVILERESQHTSDHFWKTKDLLDDRELMIGGVNPPKFVILVPAPVAERRALATGRHRWLDSHFRVEGIPIGYEQYMAKTDHRLAIGRMVGEVERILYYPRRGYMDKPDQPLSELVIHAYDQLHPDFNTRPTPAPDPVLQPAAS